MLRWLCLFACLYMLLGAAVAFAETVTLRARIEASGPAVTMGDVFAGAPAHVAGRAIAPAPAAGLDFAAPAGVQRVEVVRPGGARATLAAPHARQAADAVVRRGDSVTLEFAAPGIAVTMRARALEDGAVGERVRFLNTSSNRTVEAVVTGPGFAQANP